MSGPDLTLHPDLLRLRGALYDRVTGLPSLPVLLDEMREMLERRRCLGIIHASIPSLATAETVYGWQLFDRVAARLSTEMQRLCKEVLPAGTRLAQLWIHDAEVVAVVPDAPDGRSLEGGALRDLARAVEVRLRETFAGEEYATLVPRPDPRAGFALVFEDPFYRFERLVYRAVDEARARPRRSEALRRRSWGEEVQRIIREEGIEVHYQPVVELRTLEVIGYEALSRGPAGSGLESPALMFEVSREAGVAAELDRLCRRVALASVRGLAPGRKIFLNVRPDHLGAPDWLGASFDETLRHLELRPGDLVVEVPHPGALADEPTLVRLLGELKARGFRIAIDDLGTGYAGLQCIERLEPDFLKIDVSLVRGIDANLLQQELLASLVRIGGRIGATVIAEGIEREEELDFLRRHGAQYGQGFLFSAAVPSLLPGPMTLGGRP